MSESFNLLAQAAVIKSETLNNNTKTIITLAKTFASLTATNATLAAALAPVKYPTIAPPPGFQQAPLPGPQAEITGQSLNSLSQLAVTRKMPRNKERWCLTKKQFCKTCGKNAFHLPAKCSELPRNKTIKASIQWRIATSQAKVAAATTPSTGVNVAKATENSWWVAPAGVNLASQNILNKNYLVTEPLAVPTPLVYYLKQHMWIVLLLFPS